LRRGAAEERSRDHLGYVEIKYGRPLTFLLPLWESQGIDKSQ
jgi:hypothetical protein